MIQKLQTPSASECFHGRKIYVGAWRWWEYYLGFAPALYFLQKIDKHICIGVGREEQIELKVEGEPPPPFTVSSI